MSDCPLFEDGCAVCKEGLKMWADGEEVLHWGYDEDVKLHVVTAKGHTVYTKAHIVTMCTSHAIEAEKMETLVVTPMEPITERTMELIHVPLEVVRKEDT